MSFSTPEKKLVFSPGDSVCLMMTPSMKELGPTCLTLKVSTPPMALPLVSNGASGLMETKLLNAVGGMLKY